MPVIARIVDERGLSGPFGRSSGSTVPLLLRAYSLLGYLGFLAVSSVLVAVAIDLPLFGSTLDRPIRSAWPLALAIDLALLLGFAVQHSLMARPAFKQLHGALGLRSTFVWATNLVLAALLLGWQPFGPTLWSVEQPEPRLLIQATAVLAWSAAIACTFVHDHLAFFGVREARREPELQVIGPYRIVRHPMMTMILLALWLTPTMTLGHLLFVLGMSGYVLLGVRFEEQGLLREFGEAYADYQRRVPRLLPRFW